MLTKHKGLEACIIDARDMRRTMIPGPGSQEFSDIMSLIKDTSPITLPWQYRQFFRLAQMDGLSMPDLTSDDCYTAPDETTSVTTKAIKNDYTVYSPLDATKREIRLVYLPPGAPRDTIVVALRTVPHPWADRHIYVALSYTWGPMDETRRIVLAHDHRGGHAEEDGEPGTFGRPGMFSCTANLEMALRALRRKDSTMVLWIDALCINQGDLEERARQVGMMADIYSRATQVAIWLGSDPETEQAVKKAKLLSLFLEEMKKAEDVPKRLQSDQHVLEHMVTDFNLEGNALSHSELAPQMARLLANPWFSRAWVVQEVWAARSIVVLCGEGTTTSWKAVMQANWYTTASNHPAPCDGRAPPPIKHAHDGEYRVSMVPHAIWPRLGHTLGQKNPNGETKGSVPVPLLELLDMVTMQLKAGDKRDLIYSILGMSVEAGGLTKYPLLITPNYNKPAWQVYADFTRWFIGQDNSLNILGHVTYARRGHATKLDGPLPSWSLSPSLNISWSAGGSLSDRTPFQADAGTPHNASLVACVPGDRSLVTQGYEMDSVDWVDSRFFSPTFRFQGAGGQASVAPYPWRMTLGLEMDAGSCGLEWLWRTMCKVQSVGVCDTSLNTDGDEAAAAPCRCERTFEDMIDAVTGGRWMRIATRGVGLPPLASIRYTLLDRSTMYAWFASHWVATTTDPEMKLFCQRLRNVLLPLVEDSLQSRFADAGAMEASYKKCLFVTRGGAVGVCPPHAKKGDSVVVLFGCRTPVILARAQDASPTEGEVSGPVLDEPWEFVGECYVNGLMDGELTRKKSESGVPVQTFTLQ